MSKIIDSVDTVENIVGKVSKMGRLKTIDHLDEGVLRWIGSSTLMFMGFGGGSEIGITIGTGEPGWVKAQTHELWLPISSLDEPDLAQPSRSFGSIFLIPSINEVIRVNGRVSEVTGDHIIVRVSKCFTHCGKSLLRSQFWKASPDTAVPNEVAPFISASSFMLLATINAQGNADISPRGDMVGMLAYLDEGVLYFPDRPGNKRIDSFRNILTQPKVAALLVIPGSAQVAFLSGTARITTDEVIRARFTVKGKTPALVTAIENVTIDLRQSQALSHASLWPASEPPEGIDLVKIGIAHLKMNKSLGMKLAGVALSSMSGIVKKGMEQDYKKNLF